MLKDRGGKSMNDLVMESDTSAHTSARMSAPRPRIEVITGVERRRRWSWDQKRAIVEESLSADAPAAAIARKHGIGTGQLYTWRGQLLRRQLAGTPQRFACVDVAVASGPRRLTGPIADPVGGRTSVIEIALADGTSVRVNADVDEPALRRVLAVLRG
jgi:transposase